MKRLHKISGYEGLFQVSFLTGVALENGWDEWEGWNGDGLRGVKSGWIGMTMWV